MPAMSPSYWPVWVGVGYLAGSVPFALLIGKARGVDIRQHGSGNVGATNVGRTCGRRWGVLCFILDVLKGALPVILAGHFMHWPPDAPPPPDIAQPVAAAQQIAQQAAQVAQEVSQNVAQALHQQTAASPWVTSGGGTWQWCWLLVAVAAVLGHMFPLWLRFRGGKGVATGLGALLGFYPLVTLPALAAAATWIVLVKCFRYVSLASMVAACALPGYLALWLLWDGVPLGERLPFFVITILLAALVVLRHRANIGRLLAGTESKVGAKPKPADDQPPTA